jgi:hypothetical protein
VVAETAGVVAQWARRDENAGHGRVAPVRGARATTIA